MEMKRITRYVLLRMNRWVKRVGILCLIPIVLVLLVSALLYVPAIQNFAVKKATAYASETTGMSISIERIRLSFPLNLSVRGVQVHASASEKIVVVDELIVLVKPLPLLKSELSINGVTLKNAFVDTHELIDGMTIRGAINRLYLKAEQVLLKEEKAVLDLVELSDSDLFLETRAKTEEEDTASVAVNWQIGLKKVRIDNLSFSYLSHEDSSRVSSFLSAVLLTDGWVDLGAEDYAFGHLGLTNSSLCYDADEERPASGLDPAHIDLTQVGFSFDSVQYRGKEMNAIIRGAALKDRSGLEVVSVTGRLKADTTAITIPEILLKTPYSEARLLATIPWNSINEEPEQKFRALFSAFIGKEDVLLFSGMPLSGEFAQAYPDRDLRVAAGVEGNLSSLRLQQVKAELDSAFYLNASGNLRNLTDSVKRAGAIDFEASTGSLDFLLSLFTPETRGRLALPRGMTLTGKAGLQDREYNADLLFAESSGKVSLAARYDLKTDAYNATLKVDSLEPVHFMPQDSLFWLTAFVEADGQGTDLFSKRTRADLKGRVSDIRYGATSVSDVSFNASLKEHQFDAAMDSRYPLALMTLSVSGVLEKNKLDGIVVLDMEKFDFYGFHQTEKPFSMSFQLFTEVRSDFRKDHLLDVTLGNWEITTSKQAYKPKTLTLHALSNPDTTRVSFHTGDLGIVLTGTSDLLSIQNKLLQAQQNVMRQLERDTAIDVEVLRPDLPEMLLTMSARKDNPLYNIMQYFNVSFSGLDLFASTSPEDGLRMNAGVYTIIKDSMLLDTVRMAVRQDTLGLLYNADVIKKKYLNQESFAGGVYGKIRKDFADATLHYTDQRGKTGLDLGMRADKTEEGIRMTFFPEQPIVFFHPFNLNKDNFIHLKSKENIEANLRFTGEENASLWIHSIGEGAKMEELHAELSQINLDVISKGFSFAPNLKGLLNADFQYAPIDSSYMLLADVNIDNLLYEGGRVGEMMLNAVFLPIDAITSQIDMHVYRDREEFLTLTSLYSAGKKTSMQGEVDITELPLAMFSPFIPDKMASLNGRMNGRLIVGGSPEAPLLNGSMRMDSASVYIAAAASTYRFDDKPLTVVDNQLSFNKYKIYATGENPFVLNGSIDMKDPSQMMADLTMNAENLQLLNVKRNRESIVYGKLYVNMNSTLKGPLQALRMRGNIRVLGNTDVTYVMTESPLTVQDRLDGLVTFVSFGDTLFNKRRRPMGLTAAGEFDMMMTLRIDPAVRMKIDLTPDRSSYVELEGGGDLALQYTEMGDMLLNGRYTLTGGNVRYELPIVSAKNFTIQEGSYIEWSGDMMNPRLNLTATERVRTSVAPDGQASRLISFDVGIKVQQTMENMALDFTLSAPEDMNMQNELTAKGPDERRKLAVGLLVTGMYMGGSGSGGNMNMGAALNSFLQNEINNIAGSALKTVDISFGMDSYDDAGGSRTDYSFRFAKRFYNDRIRVVIGGRLSSGDNVAASQSDNFIDNVSIEYRLDEGGSRYVKLFHNKNYESLLEGEIIETGAGIVLRKRMVSLSELFDFRKKKVKPITEEE